MSSALNALLDALVEKFIDRVARRDITDGTEADMETARAELQQLWKECTSSATATVTFGDGTTATAAAPAAPKKKAPPKKKAAKKAEDSADEDTEHKAKCRHKPTRGKSKDVECGKDAMPGKKMCSTHKKFEPSDDELVHDDTDDEAAGAASPPKGCTHVPTRGAGKGKACGKDVVAGTTVCSKHTAKKEKSDDETENPDAPKKKLKVIKKHGDKWVHTDSGLVVKSSKEPVVVGRMVDGEVKELTDEDRATAEELGFECE
jgi:hypothetical protein